MTKKTTEMIQQKNNIKDRPAIIDSLLKQLRNEMNELSEQGNDITKKMWNVYSSIDCLMTDQKKDEFNNIDSVCFQKTDTSSYSDSCSTNNSSLVSNFSKENIEKINKGEEKDLLLANKKIDSFNEDKKTINLNEDFKQLPALDNLYATVTKNLNVAYENLKINEANVLNDNYNVQARNNFTNKIYPQINYNNANNRKSRLNIKLNNRRPALNLRTAPVNVLDKANENFNEDCYKNHKSLIINLHNSNLGSINNGKRNSPSQYLSDADSAVSYEAIDNLGSNSIDSGYKSCCQTPDFYSTQNLFDRKTGGRFSFDASVRSSSSNSFNHQNISFDQSSILDEKLFKHYQKLLANNSLASIYTSVHLRKPKKNKLVKNENTFKNSFSENEDKRKDFSLKEKNNFTFKSALALKKMNENNISRTLKNKSLSQSEQNLDNWDISNIYSQLNKKPKNLMLNKSNLSLDGNEFFNNNYSCKEFVSSKNNFIFNQNFINDTYPEPKYKIIKRKLPQINYLTNNLSNTSDLTRNKVLTFKKLHSSDLKLNQSEEKYSKINYSNNKKLLNRFSVSNEQISKTENIYAEIDRYSLLSYNDEEDFLFNNYNGNSIKNYNAHKNIIDQPYSTKNTYLNLQKKNIDGLKSIKKTKKALSTNTINKFDFFEQNYSQNQDDFKNFDFEYSKHNNLLSLINQTRSNDDLNILKKNKLKNDKRKTFKITSPLRSITKALASETNDLMKIKEMAKNKIVNLIDNFTSASSNNKKLSNKNNWQNKYFFNKSPNKNQYKKSNKNIEIDKTLDEMTKLYFSQRQKTTQPYLTSNEHIYEELKINSNELEEIRNDKYLKNEYKHKSSKINLENLKKDEKKKNILVHQSKLESEFLDLSLLKSSFSESLNSDCEEEIKRKINSDEIITKIENVINNIDTMLSNKENLNLEYKNFYN